MNLRAEKGSAVIEFAVIAFWLSMFLGGAIEYAIALSSSQKLHNAVREGARVAAMLPNVTTDNDQRVIDTINRRLEMVGFPKYITISSVTSTAPDTAAVILNEIGEVCNAAITVHVEAQFSFAILQAIGMTEISLDQDTTMRYQQQPVC